MKTIFITGATGFLGSFFIRRLLRENDSLLYLLVRSEKKAEVLANRIDATLKKNIRFVFGDITHPRLGLKQHIADPFLPDVEEVWHIAATTDLNANRTLCEHVNFEGTRNVVQFTHHMRRLQKFYFVSTAYSCGRKPDYTIFENDADIKNIDFKNAYEESKHKAEILVRNSGLPWIILRPSIIVGDSRTGEAKSNKMIYGFIRSYHLVNKMILKDLERKGKPSKPAVRMESPENTTQNIICVDDVVNLMILIRNKNPKAGSVFHLTNPRCTSNQEVHDSICAVLNTPFFTLVPKINYTDATTEEKLLRRGTKIYKPYLLENDPVFDTSEIQKLVGHDYEIRLPDRNLLDFLFRTYFEQELSEKEIVLTDRYGSKAQRQKALRKYMSNSISYFTTGDTYKSFSIPTVEGYLPYIQVENTVVVIGDPITVERDYELILGQFIIEMNKRNISVTGLQISSDFAKTFEKHNYFVNCIGIETFVDVGSFNLSGNRMKKLRQNITSAERHGVVVVEQEYDAIDMEEVKKISRFWISNKKNTHELSVIIRPLVNSIESEVRRFVAYYQDDMVGYIFFNPIYENNCIVGYLSDIERYLGNPPGIHDYIIYKAIQSFQNERTIKMVSLGLSPLEDVDIHERKTGNRKTNEILRGIRNEESPVYSFKNVSSHKKLFKGIEKPLYYASLEAEANIDIVNLFNAIGVLTPKSLLETSDHLFTRIV